MLLIIFDQEISLPCFQELSVMRNVLTVGRT